MSKYAELEGYDFHSSEVYETGNSDNENEINNHLYNSTIEEENNEAINNSGIEVEKAYKIFSNAEEKDSSKQYEVDYLAGKIEKSKSQSLSQQLRRLIKEVDDLKFKIEQEKLNNPENNINTEEAAPESADKPSGETNENKDNQVGPQETNATIATTPIFSIALMPCSLCWIKLLNYKMN